MYNRYVPQSDGTYQRNRLPDSIPRKMAEQPTKQGSKIPPEPEKPQCSSLEVPCCQNTTRIAHHHKLKPQPRKQNIDTSIPVFLKQLLPSNFDSGDLLVVLLLLLMSGDCAEDQNTALLTLVLYLFL